MLLTQPIPITRTLSLAFRRYMVLDINLFRAEKGGNPELLRQNQRLRFKNVEVIDSIIELDAAWRQLRFKLDNLSKNKNAINKELGDKMKKLKLQKDPSPITDSPQIAVSVADDDLFGTVDREVVANLSPDQSKALKQRIDALTAATSKDMADVNDRKNALLFEVGNIVHPSVVVSDNEDHNGIVRVVGDCETRKKLSHVDLLVMIDGVDYRRGTKVAGGRGYFLKGPGVFLAQALIQLALRMLGDRGFTPLYTPFFMCKDAMRQVAQLSQFDEELYKVITKNHVADSDKYEEEEKYLIATSEQPIAAYHSDEWMEPATLPIRYAGISSCFRQEVGSHGRDTTGIFRVHQFEKVEQFCITSPETSWEMFDEMIGNAENLCKALGIPYRIVNIVSGALNNAAAKKFDLEAWFPGSGAFRELVSCSNCTDYQSRRLGIRFGQTKKMNVDVPYVHMLNATMCAVTRVLCCVLENGQTETGIAVPETLHSFLPENLKFIPFKNEVGSK